MPTIFLASRSTRSLLIAFVCISVAGCDKPTTGEEAKLTISPGVVADKSDSANGVANLTKTGEKAADVEQHAAADTASPQHSRDDTGETENATNPHKKFPANRLADETSPYLLLHAHNPVQWYPWGEEALAKAKKEGKPIFLSIGYSSCYWCHVMERESFMDEEIAKFLNKHFVCIKVDREERPDIDQIYMTALHVTGKRGGWPLSMFLTPEGKPFLGGTYFPARDGDREGVTGFLSVIQRIDEVWKQDAENIRKFSELLAKAVKTELRGQPQTAETKFSPALVDNVQTVLAEDFDEEFGGFGYDLRNPGMPKFPEPSNLLYLIERVKHAEEKQATAAREMLTTTLTKMHRGGIYDHLGGGFHRYSVDRFWRIPHFEKMLYDNGQLATVYAEAYALTENPAFRRAAEGTLDFVLREMTDPAGGFYSALDAETDAEEGKFYRWEKAEVEKLLTDDEFITFASVYGLNDAPNFEAEYYALQPEDYLEMVAKLRGIETEELWQQLAPARAKLFETRSQRKRPLTDTKILTAWNGLMIRGFADAGRIFDQPKYTEAAAKAADFILTNIRTDEGRLLRTHSAGEAKLNAYLDDYAFFVDGLIALHRATGQQKWLTAADELTQQQIEHYWDQRDGGFFFTSADHEELIARAKNPVDTVMPSGNSVSAGNLLYLATELDQPELASRAKQTIGVSAPLFLTRPNAVPRMGVVLAEYLRQFPQAPDEDPRTVEPSPPIPPSAAKT